MTISISEANYDWLQQQHTQHGSLSEAADAVFSRERDEKGIEDRLKRLADRMTTLVARAEQVFDKVGA